MPDLTVITWNTAGGNANYPDHIRRVCRFLASYKADFEQAHVVALQEVIASDEDAVCAELRTLGFEHQFVTIKTTTNPWTPKTEKLILASKLAIDRSIERLIDIDDDPDKWERRAQGIRVRLDANSFAWIFNVHNNVNQPSRGLQRLRQALDDAAASLGISFTNSSINGDPFIVVGDFNASSSDVMLGMNPQGAVLSTLQVGNLFSKYQLESAPSGAHGQIDHQLVNRAITAPSRILPAVGGLSDHDGWLVTYSSFAVDREVSCHRVGDVRVKSPPVYSDGLYFQRTDDALCFINGNGADFRRITTGNHANDFHSTNDAPSVDRKSVFFRGRDDDRLYEVTSDGTHTQVLTSKSGGAHTTRASPVAIPLNSRAISRKWLHPAHSGIPIIVFRGTDDHLYAFRHPQLTWKYDSELHSNPVVAVVDDDIIVIFRNAGGEVYATLIRDEMEASSASSVRSTRQSNIYSVNGLSGSGGFTPSFRMRSSAAVLVLNGSAKALVAYSSNYNRLCLGTLVVSGNHNPNLTMECILDVVTTIPPALFEDPAGNIRAVVSVIRPNSSSSCLLSIVEMGKDPMQSTSFTAGWIGAGTTAPAVAGWTNHYIAGMDASTHISPIVHVDHLGQAFVYFARPDSSLWRVKLTTDVFDADRQLLSSNDPRRP